MESSHGCRPSDLQISLVLQLKVCGTDGISGAQQLKGLSLVKELLSQANLESRLNYEVKIL